MPGKKANQVLAHWAQQGAAVAPEPGLRMCGSCAFKEGTIPNKDLVCIMDIHGCFMRETNFHCAHVGSPEGEEPVCAGFQYALKYLKSPEYLKTLKISRIHIQKTK